MKYLSILFLLVFSWSYNSLLARNGKVEQPNDIYLIVYITRPGFSGHVGMAIDNYKILVTDEWKNGQRIIRYDTVKDGTLTYYDLWGPPEVAFGTYNKNLKARYFKLPRSSAEPKIRVQTFLNEGLPHSFDHPCDALVRIPTLPGEDYSMKIHVDTIRHQYDYFNVRQYNCTDFILKCLNRQFEKNLDAKEFIPFSWSSTPNKFYKEVVKNFEVEVIKVPGPGIDKSFYQERILNTILSQNKSTSNEKNEN